MKKSKNFLEIKLVCPIGNDEIIRLKSELINAKKHDFLIIDTGTNDFVSMEVIKNFRAQLTDLEPCLTKFKKIALIQTPSFINEDCNPNKYHFFTSKELATKCFLKQKKDIKTFP